MTFIVATNVVASQPPDRRPTGTPHARAKKKRMAILVATTSLPAVYRPNDDCWNAARSCQFKLKVAEKTFIGRWVGMEGLSN